MCAECNQFPPVLTVPAAVPYRPGCRTKYVVSCSPCGRHLVFVCCNFGGKYGRWFLKSVLTPLKLILNYKEWPEYLLRNRLRILPRNIEWQDTSTKEEDVCSFTSQIFCNLDRQFVNHKNIYFLDDNELYNLALLWQRRNLLWSVREKKDEERKTRPLAARW